jgi:uncharacterized protein YacL
MYSIQFVTDHSGIVLNEVADAFATIGRNKGRAGSDLLRGLHEDTDATVYELAEYEFTQVVAGQ